MLDSIPWICKDQAPVACFQLSVSRASLWGQCAVHQLPANMYPQAFTCKFNLREVLIAGRHACIARGSLAAIEAQMVTVHLNKRLQESYLDHSLGGWRIDKDEVSSTFVKIRTNLLGEQDTPVVLLANSPSLEQVCHACGLVSVERFLMFFS